MNQGEFKMRQWLCFFVTSVFWLVGSGLPAIAQDEQPLEKLVVATKVSPPFSFKRTDGEWTGISIDLWREIAEDMGVVTEFRELKLNDFFDQLQEGKLDAAISAISITAERDGRVEFSHAYYSTGLGVAVPLRKTVSIWGIARGLLTTRFFEVVGGLVLLAFIAGLVFWRLERKRNEGMFGGRHRQGVAMGFWWSTIILLGHKGVIPTTGLGRLFAAVVMIASTIAVSVLTGLIASAMTVASLEHSIGHPEDLRHLRTATVAASTSVQFLNDRRVRHSEYPTIDEALRALGNGETDTVVYDLAMLKYRKNTDFAATIEILPLSFNAQRYAIAMQPDSAIRKSVNQSLLKFTSSDEWADVIFRYLGE
jgi:ABC-type amino acid transport substrate-binding protein